MDTRDHSEYEKALRSMKECGAQVIFDLWVTVANGRCPLSLGPLQASVFFGSSNTLSPTQDLCLGITLAANTAWWRCQ